MERFEYNARQYSHIDELALNRHITKVFGWTFLGLLTTSATVLFIIMGLAYLPETFVPFMSTAMNVSLFVVIGQMVLIFSLVRNIEKKRPATVKLTFLGYSVSMGLLFTWVALSYELAIIGTAFLVTSALFGFMAIYGVITKQDLTRYGSILTFAVFGLIIAILVNAFMGNAMLDMLITTAGIFIFLGLTVYNTNNIKYLYANSLDSNGEATAVTENLAVYSALSLYLNFINLFLYILRFMGGRR